MGTMARAWADLRIRAEMHMKLSGRQRKGIRLFPQQLALDVEIDGVV